jgi:hypothetical protein
MQIGEVNEPMRRRGIAIRSRRTFSHFGSNHLASATTASGAASSIAAMNRRRVILIFILPTGVWTLAGWV